MGRVAVVGSANMDLVFCANSLPKPGETLLGTDFSTTPGGKGANQAVASALLNAETFFVGCIGQDSHGERLIEALEHFGVNTPFVQPRPNVRSGVAGISVDSAGQNTIIVVPGANAEVSALQVKEALSTLKPDVVLVQFEIPEEAVLACAGPWKLIVNPAPARPVPPSFWPLIDIITPNEVEAEALTGIAADTDEGCRAVCLALLGRGVRCVVVTLGARGCCWSTRNDFHLVPIFPVETVDTTAAGDVFNGALACFLAEGENMSDAVTLAVKAAALSTASRGAQVSMPARSKVLPG